MCARLWCLGGVLVGLGLWRDWFWELLDLELGKCLNWICLGWSGFLFFFNISLYGAVFEFVTKTVLMHHCFSCCWTILAQWQGFLFCFTLPSGRAAGIPDPSCPEGYFTPCNIMLSYENQGLVFQQWLLWRDWVLVWSLKAYSNYLLPFFLFPLLIKLFLSNPSFSCFCSGSFPPSSGLGSEHLGGCSAAGWAHPTRQQKSVEHKVSYCHVWAFVYRKLGRYWGVLPDLALNVETKKTKPFYLANSSSQITQLVCWLGHL